MSRATKPMDPFRRVEVYRAQRHGGELTPRQRRRVDKVAIVRGGAAEAAAALLRRPAGAEVVDRIDGAADGTPVAILESKKALLVSGHTLRHEGKPYEAATGKSVDGGGAGSGLCSCGAFGPVENSDAARKRWHRQHKLDVVAT